VWPSRSPKRFLVCFRVSPFSDSFHSWSVAGKGGLFWTELFGAEPGGDRRRGRAFSPSGPFERCPPPGVGVGKAVGGGSLEAWRAGSRVRSKGLPGKRRGGKPQRGWWGSWCHSWQQRTKPSSPFGKTLRCRAACGRGGRFAGFRSRAKRKHVRGGAGKPALRRRVGTPQRGQRHEGIPWVRSFGCCFCGLRGGVNPSKLTASSERDVQQHGRNGVRKRAPISGRSNALKAEAHERSRDETSPGGRESVGRKACLASVGCVERPVKRLAESVETL
jgi:hypothetical protein